MKTDLKLLRQNKPATPTFSISSNSGSWHRDTELYFDRGLHHYVGEHILNKTRSHFTGQFLFIGFQAAVQIYVESALEDLVLKGVLKHWFEDGVWLLDLREDRSKSIKEEDLEECPCCNGVMIRGNYDLEESRQWVGVKQFEPVLLGARRAHRKVNTENYASV